MDILSTLPTEILFEIVSNIGRMRDLAALSTQCRRLHEIVDMPTFRQFHRIRLDDRFFDRLTFLEDDHPSSFILHILRNPKLGAYVRQLEVCDPRPPFRLRMTPEMDMDMEATEDVGLVGSSIVKAGLSSHKEKIVTGFFMHSNYATSIYGVLLITVCPNIDTLQISKPQFPLDDFLKKNNSRNSPSKFLRRLRTIKVFDVDEDDPRFYETVDFMGMIKLFHRLPSVQTIGASAVRIDEEGGTRRLVPRKSNFSQIHFDHSCIDSEDLGYVIQSCKSLDSLEYSIGGRADNDGSYAYVVPKSVGLALRQHKSTLRCLDLDVDQTLNTCYTSDEDEPAIEQGYDTDDSDLEDEDNADCGTAAQAGKSEKFGGTIGSFREFTALKRLSIGINLILGNNCEDCPPPFRLIDALPPNLEYLCIRGYLAGADDIHTDHVQEFIQYRAEKLPQLREVVGVEEFIPSADHVYSPDDRPELLFPQHACNEWDSRESSDLGTDG